MQTQFDLICSTPEYYYVYFDTQYICTLNLIYSLEQRNVQPAHLIPPRIALAKQAAKKAITLGISKNKDVKILKEHWEAIENIKEKDILESEQMIDVLETLVTKIERYCVS